MFSPVDSIVVDFKGRWWLLVSPSGLRSLLGWLRVAPLKQRGSYLLIALQRSSQYWAKKQ